MGQIRCAVLTISDRSARGERPDTSGVALADKAKLAGWQVMATALVPDEIELIKAALIDWCDQDNIDLILTTGGTGFSPRDITPEATLAVVQRLAPGIAEAMRMESLRKTPHGMLSRGVAGIRGHTLIINFPGSPKAVLENLDVVMPVLPHAIELITDRPGTEQGHQFSNPK
jgi:molybdopterin adenylyltransferase